MYGRRVKPHLRVLGTVSSVVALATAILSMAAVVVLLSGPVGAPIRRSIWAVVLSLGVSYFMGRLVYLAFKVFYRWFGLMTSEEARDFPFRGRYPDSWLEPIDNE